MRSYKGSDESGISRCEFLSTGIIIEFKKTEVLIYLTTLNWGRTC